MSEIEIEIRKKFGEVRRESQKRAKPTKCIICGKETSEFCNSHSIPQFALKNIASNGQVINGACALDIFFMDSKDGINRSGTFVYICRECDSKIFADYENEEALLNQPSNLLMAEIDLKNTLIQLAKRHNEVELYNIIQEKTSRLHNKSILDTTQSLDIRDYLFDYNRAKAIIDNNLKRKYKIVYSTVLPYVVPIATQSGMALEFDLVGNRINDIYNLSASIRIETLHCCVFPLSKSTRILLFHHREDKKYYLFDKQFSELSESDKLKQINYLVFQYTENYFAADSIKNTLQTNDALKELCRESGSYPFLGIIPKGYPLFAYRSPSIDRIPNFLGEQYKIR